MVQPLVGRGRGQSSVVQMDYDTLSDQDCHEGAAIAYANGDLFILVFMLFCRKARLFIFKLF